MTADRHKPTIAELVEEARYEASVANPYGGDGPLLSELADVLESLAEELRTAKAEAWDEGALAVVELLGIEMVPVKPGEDFSERPVNPYRKEAADE